MFELLWTQLQQNEFLSGGAVLGAAGLVLRYIPIYLYRAYNVIYNRCVVQIDIQDHTDVYTWASKWLKDHPYTKRTKRIEMGKDGFKPSPGTHWIWGTGPFWWTSLMWLDVDRETLQAGSNNKKPVRESYTFRFIGNRARANTFLKSLQRLGKKKQLQIHTSSFDWWTCRDFPLRSLKTLHSDVAQPVLDDVKLFLTRRAWYNERAVTWKRNLLLQGPPGTGKTSLVKCLASECNLPVYVMPAQVDRWVAALDNEMKSPGIILIEDLDRHIEEVKPNHVQTIMNILDGVGTLEGFVTIITANDPSKLPAGLKRAGRIDAVFEVDYPTEENIQNYLKLFEVDLNAKELYDVKATIAEVQSLCLSGGTIEQLLQERVNKGKNYDVETLP